MPNRPLALGVLSAIEARSTHDGELCLPPAYGDSVRRVLLACRPNGTRVGVFGSRATGRGLKPPLRPRPAERQPARTSPCGRCRASRGVRRVEPALLRGPAGAPRCQRRVRVPYRERRHGRLEPAAGRTSMKLRCFQDAGTARFISSRPKTVLITGINGQDGGCLAKRLVDKSHQVRGIKRRNHLAGSTSPDLQD